MKVTMSPSPLFFQINQLIKMATIKDYYGVSHITMRPAKYKCVLGTIVSYQLVECV